MAFTYFFRDLHVLQLAMKHVVPEISGRSRIRIWDAGCAMGPEPYSLAILFAENMGKFAFENLTIHSTDINEGGDFDKIIAEGMYHEEPLSRIPVELLSKYFAPADRKNHFVIDERIRKRVVFQRHDLLSLKSIRDDFSLIVCKNVLLHFNHLERINVIKMFYNSLSANGYFVTEQTQKIPEEVSHLFERVASDGQLYRKIANNKV
jgi:chemotaxis protein methyltransferase CheR